MNTFNITADLVTRNQIIVPNEEIVNVNDVFDIPDMMAFAPMSHAAAITSVPTEQMIQNINQSAMTDVMNQTILRNTQHSPTPSVSTKRSDVSISVPNPIQARALAPAPAPAQAPAQAQAQARTPAQAPAPAQAQAPAHAQAQARTPAQAPARASAQASAQARANSPSHTPVPQAQQAQVSSAKTTPKHRSIITTNTKIIVEEEDKDTAIDYDDDDPEIKKTKLSLFHFAKDITFNLIFTIPFLRTKLHNILREPTLAINQIERVFDEFKDQLNRQELESLKKYVCEDGIRDKLNYILETGFNKILSDGKIDINDAPQFNQLVYFIIRSFNNINQGKVYRFYVSKEHVMLLLHFILKSVFTLTLKGNEEQMAIGLLDTSFKLVQLEVLPLISKRWYHRFRICHAVKEIEELIE